jgi:membrane protease YdiL (CAAX protease family)
LAKSQFLVFNRRVLPFIKLRMTKAARAHPSPPQAGVRPLPVLLLYLAFVFIGAALIAPWIYFAVQKAAQHSPSFVWLSKNPFHRFVHRALLLFAIVGLWPFCRFSRITWQGLGLRFSRAEIKKFAAGLVVGFISLALVAACALVSGAREFHQPSNPATIVIIALLTAVGVGFIEELIFRGALFGSLKCTGSWKNALIVSSAIYAIVHFFSRPAAPPEVTWLSGFFILKEMLHGFVDLHSLVPGFLNLAIVGAILAFSFQVTRTLWFSIGLHAGWIFWVQTYGGFTVKSATSNEWFWGTTKLIDGWMATILIVVVLGFLLRWLPKQEAFRK